MLVKFAEAIQKWVGWCPNRAAAAPLQGSARCADWNVSAPPDGDARVMRGMLVDYGMTGLPLLIVVTIGLAAMTAFMLFLFRPAMGVGWAVLILVFSVVVLAGDVMRASIAVDRQAITIHRPLSLPLVIPRDTIVNTEVKPNRPAVPLWILAIALVMFFASSAAGLYVRQLHPDAALFLHVLVAGLFSVAIFYHAHVRARYAGIMALTTSTAKVAVIYADDPERIAGMLEMS